MTAQERYEEHHREIEPEAEPEVAGTGARTAPQERDDQVGGTADLIRPPAGHVSTDPAADASATAEGDEGAPLLPVQSEERFRSSWEAVQVTFVDEPRESVRRADQLVAELMKELAEGFAEARSKLEADWDRGEDVSTEDLRQALQRYRSFFQRLLAA